MAGKIITDFIKMQLFKKGGAIASDEAVKFSADALEKRLINLGVDPNSINNQTQLKQLLAYVKQAEDQQFNQLYSGILSGDEAAKFLNKAFPKKGEVIPFPQKRSFKEEIEAMKKSGDIVDADNIKISEKITDREMFKDANKRFKGPIKEKQDMGEFGEINVETDYSSSINRPEFFDPKAKNMYGKTVKTGAEFIGKEKERILNLINNKKKNMVPPTHSNYKLLKKSLQDQEDALEAIKITEDLGGNENMFDYLRTQNIADYKAKPLQRSNYTKTDAEIKAEIEANNRKGIEAIKKGKLDDPEDMAKGGRAGFYTGGITDVEPSLDDIGHGADALNARTRLLSPGAQATTSTGLNYLLADDNDNMRIPFGNAGKVYDYNSFDHKINELKSAYKRYKKGSSTSGRGGVMTFEQFAPLFAKENFAEGGRIGFQGGGDPKRRAFLKLLATLGGGIAGLKSGLFRMGGKEAGKKAVTETIKQSAGSGTPPPYFFKLVEKIKMLGDDTLATKDKTIAKKYKDYTMEEDFAGNIEIIKKGANPNEEVYIKYTADDVELPNKKGFTKAEEYEEFTARPDGDGKMKDIEQGVPDEVVMEVEAGSGNVSESFYTGPNAIKKADGGRIGLFLGGGATAGKGLAREMLKFMTKGSSNAKSPAEILKMMNPKQFEKLLDNPAMFGKISPQTGQSANEMIIEMIKKTKDDRSSMVGDLIGSARKIKKVDDSVIAYKKKIIKDMIDGGIDEDTAYTFAEKMAKEMKEAAAPQLTASPPKITEQGLLELENIQKNLLTKGRKLQATGGLTTMLGE